MNKKNQFIGAILFNVLIYGLLFYAMSRTLHFVNNTMPGGKAVWGYLFLLATGGGAVIWKNVYLGKATGFKQRALAFSMALIDLVAELVLVYADVMYVSGENGAIQQMTTSDLTLFINASVGIVALNILAGFLFGLWDPETEKQERARDLVDDVADAAMKNLNTPESKARMIQEHAPMIEAAVMRSVLDQVVQMAGSYSAGARPLLPANDELHAQTIHYPLKQQAIPHPTIPNQRPGVWVPADVYDDLASKYPEFPFTQSSKQPGKDEPITAGSPFPVG